MIDVMVRHESVTARLWRIHLMSPRNRNPTSQISRRSAEKSASRLRTKAVIARITENVPFKLALTNEIGVQTGNA